MSEVATARARLFGLKPVITVVHDFVLDANQLDVQRLLAHMLDRPVVATHEIPCVTGQGEVVDWLIEQYPQLVDVNIEGLRGLLRTTRFLSADLFALNATDQRTVEAGIVDEWLSREALRLGRDTLMIEPLSTQAAWRIAEHCGDLSVLTQITTHPSSN